MRLLVIFALVFLTGCSFKFEVTSGKTALERQILGNHPRKDKALVLYSVFRGESKKDMLSEYEYALLNQKFNKDDLLELQRLQVIGERNNGYVIILGKELKDKPRADPEALKLAKLVVFEENKNREAIWKHSITNDPNLGSSDMSNVRKNYASNMRDGLEIGAWFQTSDGEWERKQSE